MSLPQRIEIPRPAGPPPAKTAPDEGAEAERERLKADAWPVPKPLPTLPAVPTFPMAILPEVLAPWVEDLADRARYPADFAAVTAMCALGTVIGRKLGIRLKARDDWTEYGNLWGCLVGSPSSLKSPAMRDALAPLKRLQVAADTQHAEALAEHTLKVKAARLKAAGAEAAIKRKLAKNPEAPFTLDETDEPKPPKRPCFWTSDATVEKLGELLAENPNGLLVERDELSSLLSDLDREEKAAARGFFLSGWSGKEGYRFDRIIRGTVAIPAFALSVLGGIQPGPLERYVRGARSGDRADGLLQRFQLIVWPDPQEFELVDRWPDQQLREGAHALFEMADNFKGDSIGTRDTFGDAPPHIHLDREAQGLFAEWYPEFMRTRQARELSGEDAPAVAAHFGKYPGLLGKLALVLHVADEPGCREVGARTLTKALAWIEYLEPHARRVYHALDAPDADTARLLLAKIRKGRQTVPDPFKARDIYRNGWHGLTDAKAVKAACELLADFDYLKAEAAEPEGPGRRPDPSYFINPRCAQ